MEQFLSAKFLSGRNANQKIGILDSTENVKVLEVVGRAGIGTTIFDADYQLDVRGDAFIRDTLTVDKLTVTGAGSSFADLNVTGVSTFGGNIDANAGLDVDGLTDLDELNVAGIATFASDLDVNASVDISTDLTVDGLTDLDELNVAGIATFASNIDANAGLDVDGLTDLDELNVAGIATFASNLDVNASVDILNNLTVEGLSYSNTLDVTGIATFGSDLDVNASVDISDNLSVTGIATFDSSVDINGDLTVNSKSYFLELDVAGISTFTSNVDINASVDISGHTELDTLNVSVATTSASLTLANAGVAVTAILDEDDLISNRDDALATQQSIKAYVDSQITSQDLDFAGDTGTGAVDLDSETFTVAGTTNEIETVGSGTTLTIGLPNTVAITTSLTVGSATTITGAGIVAGIVTGTLDNDLTLATSGTGLSGSATYNNSGAATFTVASNATDANTGGTIVARDGSGNFSAGTITADLVGDVTGDLTGVASTATKLQNARDFSITGSFVTAPAISFDGTGNVALAATITPDSIGLGTYTSGDYVQSITGTSNEIEVTGGTGEGSTPQIGLPNDVTISQDLTVNRDVQIVRNLNVDGNITVGGTTATIFAETLKVSDADLILGVRTDALGNDIATDNTANHGGIAIASTEGNPLVDLYVAGIETVPTTYKKIMWFKAGTFAGLGTDAWLSNYAVGVGSTQLPYGTRFAAGNVQVTENDISVVRDINASGIITASRFTSTVSTGTAPLTVSSTTLVSNLNADLLDGQEGSYYTDASNINAGTIDNAYLPDIITSNIDVTTGVSTISEVIVGSAVTINSSGINAASGIVTALQFIGTASTASFATTAYTLDGKSEGELSVGTAVTATNLAGGDAGDIPYQSAEGTTTFVDATGAGTGQVLLWNGSAPVWDSVTAASGNFGGITVQDEGVTVGTASSVGTINFVGGNIQATATTGANGISTVTLSDTPTFDSLTLESTDAGSAAAPELTLYRNSASPAPADYLGQIMFKGRNDNNAEENYAKITGKILDETLGTEDGLIETAIKGNGSFVIVSRQRSDELQLLNGVGLSVDGSTTLNGNVSLGDASTDTISAYGHFDTDLDPIADNIYDLGNTSAWRNLNISGIATLGTVEISSGIVTAVSGVVTYYGDGQYLDGINTELINDTTPQLGGNLDLNGNNIDGTGNVNITGIITATSFVGNLTGNASNATLASSSTFIVVDDESTNTNCNVLFTTAASGNLAAKSGSNLTFNSASGILTATTFSGNLDLNNNDITGTGDVNITGIITATSFVGDGSGITGVAGTGGLFNLVEDTTPQLGGNLDLNSNNIDGTGNIDITGIITATSFVGDGSGITGVAGTGGLFNVVEDTTPQLGGNLDLNSYSIDGIGNINITGIITTSGDINVGNDITLYASTGIISATSYYGSGGNLEDIIGGKIGGLQVQEEGSDVGIGFTFATLNFVGPGVTATAGIGSTATITIPGDISVDTTPQLGGNLDLNSNDITGTGNIDITGIITATSFATGAEGSAIRISSDTISGPAEIFIDPSAVGDNTGSVRIKGDLYVDGTTTQINSTTIELADFIVGIATTATTDSLADGAGIQIGPDNTLLYDHSNTSLKSSENLNLASGKTYKIDGTDVLSATTLGSGVVNSSLTSVGTLTNLNVSGVVTASSFVGDITGTASTATNITLADESSDTTCFPIFATDATGDQAPKTDSSALTYNASTGTLSATAFSGDGSNLTGVSAGTTPTENTTNQAQFIPFFVSTASTDVAGISTQSFVFNPSTTRMGIGTDSPQATLHVVDEFLVSTSGAGSTQRITQKAYTTDNGTLSWEGSAGQLFSVTNNLTSGSIFSVNDVSGIPSIDVDADGTIQLAPYGSTELVGIGTTNPTSKLHVVGDLLVTGVSTLGTLKIETGIVTATSGIITYYGDGQYLSNISSDLVNDTTPQLGGNLDLNSNNIDGTGNIDITGIITATSFVGDITGTASTATNITLADESSDTTCFPIFATDATGDQAPKTDSSALTYNASTGTLSATAFSGDGSNITSVPFNSLTGIVTHIVGDTNPQLGGNLDLNSNNIDGTGNIDITGIITATSFEGDGSALTGISAGTTPTENTTNQSQYIPFYVGTSSTDVAGISTQSFVFNPSTKRMGIGTDAPAYNLHVVGDFAATSKSFVIDHPTKSGKKLRYASLEGPEQGVYVRGRSQEAVIDLPDYWTGLVDEESITVNLTPIGHSAAPRVESIVNNTVNVFSKEEGELDYYYTVYAERKDIEKLVVEY